MNDYTLLKLSEQHQHDMQAQAKQQRLRRMIRRACTPNRLRRAKQFLLLLVTNRF
ncbi:MAG: hypothetical protein AAFV93_13920 [Chloroflexota bacterium]